MAQGYARGRAHIRELNRQNNTFYIMRRACSGSGKEFSWMAFSGPFDSNEGRAALVKADFERKSGWQNSLMSETDAMVYDPEGVARLKANPKL